MKGDLASAYKLFEKLDGPWYRIIRSTSDFFDLLDAFDGIFGTIEQSITGDFGTTYKKIISMVKWVYFNVERQYEYEYNGDYDFYDGYDYQWTAYE